MDGFRSFCCQANDWLNWTDLMNSASANRHQFSCSCCNFLFQNSSLSFRFHDDSLHSTHSTVHPHRPPLFNLHTYSPKKQSENWKVVVVNEIYIFLNDFRWKEIGEMFVVVIYITYVFGMEFTSVCKLERERKNWMSI